MAWSTHPVGPDRVEDFADVVNPNRRTTHCWCLSHRLRPPSIEALGHGSRRAAFEELCRRDRPPGVLLYQQSDERPGEQVPVAWCSIGPRAENERLVGSRVRTPLDDVPVWSVICVVVRAGHRRQGVTRPLLDGAVAWAAQQGAPAVEAYPVDSGGDRIDVTMAFVGTRPMFEQVGFEVVGTTQATGSGRPRVVMRRWCR